MKNRLYCKILAVGIFLFFLGFSIHPVQSNNSFKGNILINPVILRGTIYVDNDNTDGPWNGTQHYPYQFIQDGVNASKVRDTVYVYSGIYYENIVIDKSIELIGENRNTTIIDGRNLGIVVNVTANRVTISGFNIQHCAKWYSGIILFSDSNRVSNNIFTNIESGVIAAGNRNIVSDNIFYNIKYDAIILGNSLSNIAFKNTISNCEWGIVLWGGFGYRVFQNSIKDINGDGIEIISSGFNDIYLNDIANCDDSGISLEWGGSVYDFKGIMSPTCNKIHNNNIINNGEGIELNAALLTTIKENNFINNSEEGNAKFYDCWGTRWKENYWDDWSGTGWYKIKGELMIFIFREPWFEVIDVYNFDKNPASDPYDIEV